MLLLHRMVQCYEYIHRLHAACCLTIPNLKDSFENIPCFYPIMRQVACCKYSILTQTHVYDYRMQQHELNFMNKSIILKNLAEVPIR